MISGISIGFIGVGTLATAMVRGLKRRWPDMQVYLSARSETASRELASAYPNIIRCGTNAEVAANADWLALTMRPDQLDKALEGLSFTSDQIVLSCVTGLSLAELRRRCSPARVVRLLPVPTIERHEGPLLICPPDDDIREVFEDLGDLLELETETVLHALWGASATMSTFFLLQKEIIDGIVERGAPRDTASVYLLSLWRALAETSYLDFFRIRQDLIASHETPLGLNYRVRRDLESQNWFHALTTAMRSATALTRYEMK